MGGSTTKPRVGTRRGIAAMSVVGVLAVSLEAAAAASPVRAGSMRAERHLQGHDGPTTLGVGPRESIPSDATGASVVRPAAERDSTSRKQRKRNRRDPLVFLIGLTWFLIIGNCLVLFLPRRRTGPKRNARTQLDRRRRDSEVRHGGLVP
jgi:hypothetical protein